MAGDALQFCHRLIVSHKELYTHDTRVVIRVLLCSPTNIFTVHNQSLIAVFRAHSKFKPTQEL